MAPTPTNLPEVFHLVFPFHLEHGAVAVLRLLFGFDLAGQGHHHTPMNLLSKVSHSTLPFHLELEFLLEINP
jgi:hypothetical protein